MFNQKITFQRGKIAFMILTQPVYSFAANIGINLARFVRRLNGILKVNPKPPVAAVNSEDARYTCRLEVFDLPPEPVFNPTLPNFDSTSSDLPSIED